MNKKLTLFSAIIILAGIATPYGCGVFFKSRLHLMIDTFNQTNPNLQIKIDEYNNHWFTTDATYTFSTLHFENPPEMSTSDDQALKPLPKKEWVPIVTITNKIYHGPIVYNEAKQTWATGLISGHILNYKWVDLFAQKAFELVKFTNSSIWTFAGKFTTNSSLLPIKNSVAGIIFIDFGGVTCEQNHSLPIFGDYKMNAFDLTCNVKTLNVASKTKDNAFQYIMQPLHLTWSFDRKNSFALWMQSFKLTGEGATMQTPKSTAKLSAFTVTDQSSIKDINYSNTLSMHFQKMETISNIFPLINKIDLENRVIDLKAEGMKFIDDSLKKLEEKTPSGTNPLLSATSQQFYQELLPKLLQTSSHMDTTFLLSSSNGDVNANFTITWPRISPQMNYAQILSITKINGKLTIPVDVANKIMDVYADEIAPTVSLYLLSASPAPTVPVSVTSTDVHASNPTVNPLEKDFPQVVAAHLKNGDLNYTFSMKLLDLYNQQKPIAELNDFIQKNTIPSPLAEALRSSYNQSLSNVPASVNPVVSPQPSNMPPVAVKADNKQILQQQIQTWITEGYVLKNEKNEYVFVFDGSQAEGFSLNGKLVDLTKKPS